MNTKPDTIQAIIQQIGPIRGFGYCGATNLTFRCPEQHGECRPKFPSRVETDGVIAFDVGIEFNVNGKPREDWKIVVTYEQDDTYTVRMHRRNPKNKHHREILDEQADVYCDEVSACVRRMYDAQIEENNGGMIPM